MSEFKELKQLPPNNVTGNLFTNQELKIRKLKSGEEVVTFCVSIKQGYMKKNENGEKEWVEQQMRYDYADAYGFEKDKIIAAHEQGQSIMMSYTPFHTTKVVEQEDGTKKTYKNVTAKKVVFYEWESERRVWIPLEVVENTASGDEAMPF